MDDAYETLPRQDKGCDSRPLTVGTSFTLRPWWRGCNTGEGKVPSDRGLSPNTRSVIQVFFFFFSVSKKMHSQTPRTLSASIYNHACHSRVWAAVSAASFRSLPLWRDVILNAFRWSGRGGGGVQTPRQMNWWKWRRPSAVRERPCLKRLQGADLPVCQVCGRCCDQSVFIMAVWPFPMWSCDLLSRAEGGLPLFSLSFIVILLWPISFYFCNQLYYFVGPSYNWFYTIILMCIFVHRCFYSCKSPLPDHWWLQRAIETKLTLTGFVGARRDTQGQRGTKLWRAWANEGRAEWKKENDI